MSDVEYVLHRPVYASNEVRAIRTIITAFSYYKTYSYYIHPSICRAERCIKFIELCK